MKKILKTIGFSLVVLSATNVVAAEMTGKEIAEDRKLGNCLACHMIVGANLPGNIAPPLVAMKSRFSVADLKAILTPSQLDKVTKYIHSL